MTGLSRDKSRLLELLRAKKSAENGAIQPRASSATTAAPLSSAQRRLWFFDQLQMGNPVYNVPVAWRVRGDLNVAALRRAFDSVIARHEILRPVFVAADGEPAQMILAMMPFELVSVELDAMVPATRQIELRNQLEADADAPFELETGPLLRARLVRLADCDYVLAITAHHIVCDGWSIGILIRELAEFYSAYADGRRASLSELAIQYADYAHWQRNLVGGLDAQKELDYWTASLRGVPEYLDLPMDRPRPTVQSFRGATVSATLDANVLAALVAASRRANVTLAMMLHAAWVLLLSKLSGQDDIVVGLPVANRRRPEVEALVGLFVNTLAVRVGISRDTSVPELLQRVKAAMLGAYEHQNVAFERVVEVVQPVRSLSYSPVFQVMFVMQNASQALTKFGRLELDEHDLPARTTKCDAILAVRESAGKTSIDLVYATDLFDESTTARYLKYFQHVLRQLALGPSRSVDDVALMDAAEERTVTVQFNHTRADYPKDRLVHELFEAQVAASPNSIAVAWGFETLTYAELNARANRFAHYLRRRGVASGDYLPIVMSRSLHMLIGQLAAFKCGAVYVPVDPGLPAERKAFIVRDCSASHIVGYGDAQEYACGDVEFIDPLRVANEIALEVDENLQLERHPRRPAYVMYTSGSTGVPKGVIVPHHAINRLVINNGYQAFDRTDCFAHYSNPSFDASTLEVWGALVNGARIAIVAPEAVLDATDFAEALKRYGVTAMYMSVGLFNQYADVLADVFRGMNCLMVGGDSLEPGAIRRVLCASPPKRLLNVYGPTECTTYSTTYHIEALQEGVTSIPIGRPISNAQIYVLDGRRRPVPVGVTGEMYIAGDGVADGYLNRSDLTAERFVPNPFDSDRQARMYKTGDLARWRRDGIIEFLGRNDYQVKIRGFRVELSEIEACLLQHLAVGEAVVVAQNDAAGEKKLVAYVSASAAADAVEAHTLRTYLKLSLPEYMIPSAFIVLESLPLTSTGKVDRQALPAASLDAYGSAEHEPPADDSERALAEIWQNLLGVAKVGRADNFFQLGGHSLLAIKAIFVINDALNVKLKVADLYVGPTIAELAARVRGEAFEDRGIDIAREAELEPELIAVTRTVSSSERSILLTGATGFVGRFMLAEFLRGNRAKIYCMVRAKSDRDAAYRLRDVLEHWSLWRDDLEDRVVAIAGDLKLPALGLAPAAYGLLAEEVDAIYHCATSMNHLESYASAKVANVDGAKALVELAGRGRPKVINYASTLGVFNAALANGRSVNEATLVDGEGHRDSNGYVASKWVAEKVFMNAAERGVPCNIFRLGLVWADSLRGRYDELQRVYRVFKSCLLSGIGIRNYQRYEMPFTPVDFVARAMAHLGAQHREGCNVFHISSPEQIAHDVFACCNDILGTSLELLPFYDWIREVDRIHHGGCPLPAMPLVEFALSMDESAFYESYGTLARLEISCRQTQLELDRVKIVPPILERASLALALEDMMSRDAELLRLLERGQADRVGYESARMSRQSHDPPA